MKLTFSEEDMAGSSYLGVGEHTVVVSDIKMDKSKAGNNLAIFTLVDEAGASRTERVPMTANTKWRMGRIMAGLGFQPKQQIEFPAECIGKTTKITVSKVGTYKNKDGEERDNHEVTQWTPVEATPDFETDEIPF